MNATEHVDTVVVGGGQAGLALGYYLAQQQRDFVILDAHARVGDAWRQRWDSLRLFTPAKFDGLPGVRFPEDRLSFPTKDQQADYLEDYAARFDLPVHTGVMVDAVWRDEDGFLVTAGADRWLANNVVLATGGSQRPRLPQLAASIGPEVLQLHSSEYRNPAQLRPGAVVVVGVGNSGAEIALEVSRSHPTWLAGTPSGQLPVRHGRAAARFLLPLVRFVALHVLTMATPVGRKAHLAMTTRAAPLIRTKMTDLAAAGVRSVPRVVTVANGMPMTDGDSALSVDNVIWCTGYRTDFNWVHLPGFQDGARPAQARGIVDSVPGLYFLGQEFLFSAVSATVTGVRRDARYLARHMNPPLRGEGAAAGAARNRIHLTPDPFHGDSVAEVPKPR
ncbi:NAD(P)/FAD-dependent oxidoreductase [Parafrigoribacterium mesophilum]|uniref:flavin-containing monooxygenase n=1 Tax=Parafrigoribacterium mesophilum TaxID=433646 RepID=UPI0031FDE9D5